MSEEQLETVALLLETALENHPDFMGLETISGGVEVEIDSETHRLTTPQMAGALIAGLCGDWEE